MLDFRGGDSVCAVQDCKEIAKTRLVLRLSHIQYLPIQLQSSAVLVAEQVQETEDAVIVHVSQNT
jgi:hypothetical protein